nr:MAG TPA: hypothetical protein [Caudoviricetes sp.]
MRDFILPSHIFSMEKFVSYVISYRGNIIIYNIFTIYQPRG